MEHCNSKSALFNLGRCSQGHSHYGQVPPAVSHRSLLLVFLMQGLGELQAGRGAGLLTGHVWEMEISFQGLMTTEIGYQLKCEWLQEQ